MSKISKTNTINLVKFLLKKRDEEIDKAKQELGSYVERLVLTRTPTSVITLYESYPNYLRTSSCVQVSGFGFEYKTFLTPNKFPSLNGNTFQVTLVEGEVKELRTLDLKYEQLVSKRQVLSDELRNLIFTLGTYRKIVETIPESKEFLQQLYSITLVPSVSPNVSSILERLK